MSKYLTLVLAASLFLTGCGGGGGSGAGSASTTPPPTEMDFPVVLQSGAFSLPALEAPAERDAASATIQGRALIATGTPPPAGTSIALLDASTNTVIARANTAADGSFDFGAPVLPSRFPDRQVRVQLGDGTVIRAFALGWTELTPGSEVAVGELQRLRTAGAFTSHAWTPGDLAIVQNSLSLRWTALAGVPTPAQAVAQLRGDIRLLAPWNKLLDSLGGTTPLASGPDVAGLYPVDSASAPSTVAAPGLPASATFTSSCSPLLGNQVGKVCGTNAFGLTDLSDSYTLEPTRLMLAAQVTGVALIDTLLQQLGSIPLIEFPGAVGTTVLVDQARITLIDKPQVHAAARIVRRTYHAAPVSALGRSPSAVLVVLDYELAVLDVVTRESQSVLLRQKRWYAPLAGRVRAEKLRWVRNAGDLITWSGQTVAQSASGKFFDPDVPPSPGVVDVRALALKHRHAIYVPATGRIIVGTDQDGGTLLELDPDSLTVVRNMRLPAVPGKLAASADGTRLFVGLDGAALVELRMTDFAEVRRTPLPGDPYGRPYPRILDLQADPRNSNRVLLMAGGNTLGGSGAVMMVDNGVQTLRDAPVYHALDYGWSYYSPDALRWTSVADEFLTTFNGSPKSMYRFSAGATAFSEVARLQRVDDVGLDEAAGELLTDRGSLLNATTWAPLRSLGLGGFKMLGCRRQGAEAALCDIGGSLVRAPFLLHLDISTNAFLGTYRPVVTDAASGCPGNVGAESTYGLDTANLTTMDRARSLAATLPTGDGTWCSLQVWSLHGVAR